MKILFLTHAPEIAYRQIYVKELQARVKILHLKTYIYIAKTYPLLSYLHPIISFIYSFFIRINEDILIVDGGSCLYTAAFIKKRHRKLKLIYLDNDLLFYNLCQNRTTKKKMKYFFREIDGVISESNTNRKYSSFFLDVPIEMCPPYPQYLKNRKTTRKNYGLYIGRLDPDKDIKRIVNYGLQCSHIDKLIIIGDGTLKSYVKKISKKFKKLVYLGVQSDVEYYYNQCKFLIHIPDFDPHPRTTMEAALCGCFPIISKGVGTRYLFKSLFIIDEPSNFEKINNRIKFILEHESQATKLLQNSVKNIPTKKQFLRKFRKAFSSIIKKIDNGNGRKVKVNSRKK